MSTIRISAIWIGFWVKIHVQISKRQHEICKQYPSHEQYIETREVIVDKDIAQIAVDALDRIIWHIEKGQSRL